VDLPEVSVVFATQAAVKRKFVAVRYGFTLKECRFQRVERDNGSSGTS